MQSFRAAAVQLCAGLDKEANFAAAERLVDEAAFAGARLIVLPELFNLYGDLRLAAEQAEPLDGPTATMLQRLAVKHRCWIVGGSFAEIAGDGRAFNTSPTFDPQGQVRGSYRKIHLFDVDLGESLRVQESANLIPGKSVAVIETDLAKIGVSICYDLRFPELYRRQSQQGAELLCIPAAFTRTTGRDHWELLVRARAVENQCYVIAANQVGDHTTRSSSFGHSLIVDPWGRVLAAANEDQEAIIVAEISCETLADTRRKLPALQHVRL